MKVVGKIFRTYCLVCGVLLGPAVAIGFFVVRSGADQNPVQAVFATYEENAPAEKAPVSTPRGTAEGFSGRP